MRPSRKKPISVIRATSASSIASELGAPTDASTGMPARAALSTISAPVLPLTHSTPPPGGTLPCSNRAPITLSTALCRPTSSRSNSGAPADIANAAA